MAGTKTNDFQDMLPMMANKLGGDGLIRELCNGFRLLMDRDRGVITFESLKKNSALLGLQNLRDDELMSMLREGDLNGDGALDQMEFCVLMFRLSPELMEESEDLLEIALQHEFKTNTDRVAGFQPIAGRLPTNSMAQLCEAYIYVCVFFNKTSEFFESNLIHYKKLYSVEISSRRTIRT